MGPFKNLDNARIINTLLCLADIEYKLPSLCFINLQENTISCKSLSCSWRRSIIKGMDHNFYINQSLPTRPLREHQV